MDAKKKYNKANMKYTQLKFHKTTDGALLEHLDQQENKTEYVRRLIREDLAKGATE